MKLTVRLSKSGRTVAALLKPDHGLTGPVANWGGIAGAVLYYGTAYAHPPGWITFINSGVNQPLPALHSEGAVAIIFIPIDNRWVVYSFGHTASKLMIAPFERDFGLRVVLNKVDPDKIKTIDAKIVDVVVTNKRTQLSKENKLRDFGFEIDKEMLKSLGGRASEEQFGSVLAGSDTLTLNCRVTASGLQQKSVDIWQAYNSTAYRTHYKWFDNIQPVKDEALIDALNQKLLIQFNRVLDGKHEPSLQMACPEIVDYAAIDHFKMQGYRSRTSFSLPVLEDLVKDLQDYGMDVLSLDNLEQYHVAAMQGDSAVKHWLLFDWMVTEVTHDRRHYVLSEGSWFVISRSYFHDIANSFTSLVADPHEFADLGNTTRRNETDYLSHYTVTPNNMILDRDLFGYGPADTLEVCDIFEAPGNFIHVKDGGASSKLSHLFNQGYVSAVTLLSDQAFRQGVVDKLGAKPALAVLIGNPVVASDYTIAFRILKKGTRISLPFFTKVVIKDMRRKIKAMGYKFRLEWVRKV